MLNFSILLLVAANFLLLIEGEIKLSQKEKLQIENELKILNKPAVKSIHMRTHGEIYDCVNKYEQPAFDHPSLKNHKIQEKPSKNVQAGEEPLKVNSLKSMLYEDGEEAGCPPGTVPIRRTKRKNLIRSKRLAKVQRDKYDVIVDNTPKAITSVTGYSTQESYDDEAELYYYAGEFYSSRARFNIWNPSLNTSKQYSSLKMVFQATDNCKTDYIEAGWTVYPDIYGDNKTRLSTSWKNGESGKGCFDNGCPGFVQVDDSVPLGLVLTPSQIGGPQNDIEITVVRDVESGHWWLCVHSACIGYWPKQILSTLWYLPAKRVMWVGETLSIVAETTVSPPMGSGRDVNEGLGHAAYISDIKLIKSKEGDLEQVKREELHFLNSAPAEKCYHANIPANKTLPGDSFGFFVGGPGCSNRFNY